MTCVWTLTYIKALKLQRVIGLEGSVNSYKSMPEIAKFPSIEKHDTKVHFLAVIIRKTCAIICVWTLQFINVMKLQRVMS